MKKQNIMPIVVLTVICVIVAALLGGVNSFTSKEIAKKNAEIIKESLGIVMPNGSFNTEPDKLKDDAPETVKSVYTDKLGNGYVVILESTKGYTGKAIGITAAIDTDGKIIKAVVTKNEESIVPPELKPMGSYGDKYTGIGADEIADLVTGATVKFTETAIKNALYDALTYLGFAEDKVLSGAFELMPGAEGFEEVELKSTDGTVKRMLRESSGLGYVIYTHTYATYGGGLETETLIAVDNNGKITNISNLLWVVGHNVEIDPTQPPPSDESVNDFFKSFIGKTIDDVDSVDFIVGCTGTSSNVKAAVTDALSQINTMGDVNYSYRIIGICILVLAVGGFVTAMIISKKRRTAK